MLVQWILRFITQVTTTGSNQALTLANGANGQIKIVTMVTDGGDGTLTPTTFAMVVQQLHSMMLVTVYS